MTLCHGFTSLYQKHVGRAIFVGVRSSSEVHQANGYINRSCHEFKYQLLEGISNVEDQFCLQLESIPVHQDKQECWMIKKNDASQFEARKRYEPNRMVSLKNIITS